MSGGLSVSDLNLSIDGRRIVDGLSIEIEEGELVCLLGPSGCGKSTTLSAVAGFLSPDSGTIVIGGREVANEPPFRRDIGMVFQSYALFPHMTAFDNIAYGLRARKVSRNDIERRVGGVIEMMALGGLEKRYPAQLSGGQQQRVAVARAVVVEPSLLLMDEPLSNLDAKLREEVRIDFRRMQRNLGLTVLFVTHDQHEALTLADKVAVMSAGRIEQFGTAEDIFERPRNRFVGGFVGIKNIIGGHVERGKFVSEAGFELTARGLSGDSEYIGIRSSSFKVRSDHDELGSGEYLRGLVVERYYAGSFEQCVVELPDFGGARLEVEVPAAPSRSVHIGDHILLGVDERDVLPLQR